MSERPLSDDARALLDAFKAEETPSAERQQAVHAAVSAPRPRRRIQATATEGESPPLARSWVWIAGAVAAAAAAVFVLAQREPQRAEREAGATPEVAPYQAEPGGFEGRTTTPAPVRPQRSMLNVPAPVPPPVEEPEPEADTEAAPPVAVQRPTSNTRPPARTELEILREAKQALARGDAALALRLLDSKPGQGSSMLAREREAVKVEALCAAGQTERGASLARSLLERRPSHPYADALRRGCSKKK